MSQYSREELVELAGEPVLLNVGCGTDTRGVGIDLNYEQADIIADIDEGVPVESGSIDKVLLEHVLEHVENPSLLLEEIRRILAPGGSFHLEVPNAGWLPIRLYITQDIQKFWDHKDPGEKGHWLARRIGNEERDRTPHLSLWTSRLLEYHLERTGFTYSFQTNHHLFSRNLIVDAWIEAK